MTEQRYSAGAMRAGKIILGVLSDRETPRPTIGELAEIISEETGDLALIEALEVSDQRITELCNIINVLSPGKVRAEDYADKTRAALAAARKEG